MPSVTGSTTSDSDDVLLARHQNGDDAALNVLFLRYRESAYRVAYRLLSHPEDALDAVQDGFVKAMLHLGRFEHRSSFKTWLMRVVSNAALDFGRARRRRDQLKVAACGQVAPEPPGHEPQVLLEGTELRERLDEALGQLPEQQRRTFVLHMDGGLSYREVAEALEISLGTVMSRLFYARQKLKTLLADRVPS
ncbi:RNA polymerase sigma factor [Zavarzinella formosa]|uniref:RNA polymerase sigma factor n=1 Tax=Zavarzinella formosa TaxID=360055 RepID=UPI0002FED447|nr:RNA polymerase sigma factor [Zavarzinella formosa]